MPAPDGTLERIGNRPDVAALIEWALDAPPTPTPTRRPSPMRITITIDDDGDDVVWKSAESRPPYVRGPYVRGPSLVIPKDDGSEAIIEIDGLKAAADQTKGS
jgi:hypothetical protein